VSRRLDATAALLAEIEVAELAVDVALREQDLTAGLVPDDVTRALFPHEITAGTNFAALEADVTAAANRVAAQLAADRAAFLALLEQDLRNVATGVAVAHRVFDLDGVVGLGGVAGFTDLAAASLAKHLATLEAAVRTAIGRVRAEAAAQGVPVEGVAVKVASDTAGRVDLAARRLAVAPHVDVIRAAREHAYTLPADTMTAVELADDLLAHLHELAPSLLDLYARSSAQSADGLGRQDAAAALPTPAAIYASELLDRNTCGPCSLVDGTAYADLPAARKDYPTGVFRACEGGARCRGTIVFVWPSEAAPSV
jgi:hypothetical protein